MYPPEQAAPAVKTGATALMTSATSAQLITPPPRAPTDLTESGRRHIYKRMISMPFYQVRSIDPDAVYHHCGQQPDCEAAIQHFNSNAAPPLGKTLTTIPTRTPCVDYMLIEL